MHPKDVTHGLQVNPVGVLSKNVQPCMVIIGDTWGGLMTCGAVNAERTLGISVKGLSYVHKMKKVGVCE